VRAPDDLTKHADAYREMALLLGRSPGREAFPGDIFYIHAQLLERATALTDARGGGSATAFPIVETTDNDISSYIPTNLISITDGQLYLDSARFERDQRPAVDIGRSVSRVGGAAQPAALRAAARNLRITLSRFETLETLTRVGLDVDPDTRKAVERGHLMRELLRQPRFTPRSLVDQIFAVTAVAEGWLDAVAEARVSAVLWSAADRLRSELPDVAAALAAGESPPENWKQRAPELLARVAREHA
jgi:proton translocating ATP synthase F1 alpha subunit